MQISEGTFWGVVGIIVAILMGILAVRYVVKKNQKQNQRVGDGSTAIQSGRDTNIGNRNG